MGKESLRLAQERLSSSGQSSTQLCYASGVALRARSLLNEPQRFAWA